MSKNALYFSLLGCKFPPSWNGTWFLMKDGVTPTNETVGEEDFGQRGFCYKEEDKGAKYILFDR